MRRLNIVIYTSIVIMFLFLWFVVKPMFVEKMVDAREGAINSCVQSCEDLGLEYMLFEDYLFGGVDCWCKTPDNDSKQIW